MKETILIVAVVIMVVITFYGRHQSEKALALLTDEERGRFVGQFAKLRTLNLYALMIVLALQFGLVYYGPKNLNPALMYTGIITVYLALTQFLSHRKMSEVEVPDSYRKMYNRNAKLRWASQLLLVAAAFFYILGSTYP